MLINNTTYMEVDNPNKLLLCTLPFWVQTEKIFYTLDRQNHPISPYCHQFFTCFVYRSGVRIEKIRYYY